jgi:hypothetical protein
MKYENYVKLVGNTKINNGFVIDDCLVLMVKTILKTISSAECMAGSDQDYQDDNGITLPWAVEHGRDSVDSNWSGIMYCY